MTILLSKKEDSNIWKFYITDGYRWGNICKFLDIKFATKRSSQKVHKMLNFPYKKWGVLAFEQQTCIMCRQYKIFV